MKILQAIYTSVTETLDGAQGYGFVVCSKSLPVHIKEAAKDLTYPDGAGGKAIYSLKLSGEDGSWLMMNRTVPDVDYTRRPSYVSHTLAFRLDELMGFFDEIQGKIPSVFEFMLKFEWKSSWSDNETSRWIEESEDLEASPEMFYSDLDESQFSFHSLLAFDYPEDGSPIKPKRAAWQFENLTPKEMLATFHSAWLCLDPWRGTRKYKDFLAEPQVTLRDTWKYSFTTNTRGGPPDAYQWAVLSDELRTIPNRDVVIPSLWENLSQEEVKEKLGTNLGHLLVERCVSGPESWAQHALKEKLKPHLERFEEEVINAREFLSQESGKILQCVKDETEKATETWKKGVNPYCQDFQGEEEVSGWRTSLAAMNEETLQKTRENYDVYQQSAGPLLVLINAQDLAADLDFYDLKFNDIQKEFNALVAEYQNLRPYALMSESLQAIQRSETKLLLDKENLEAELASERKNLEDKFKSIREEMAAELALEREFYENKLASDKENLEAELATERKEREDKFRSGREEMAALLRDLTAKKEKITEGKRDLEVRVEKLKSRLRSERLVVLVLFVICIVCAGVYLFYKNKKQKPEEPPSKTEYLPESGEPRSGDDSEKAKSGEGNKKPEQTPKGDKE